MTPDPLAALLRDAMHLRAGTGHNTYEAVAARLRDAGVRLGDEPLDVERLARAIHELRWCKSNDLLHLLAHDYEDLGTRFREDIARAYAATPEASDAED